MVTRGRGKGKGYVGRGSVIYQYVYRYMFWDSWGLSGRVGAGAALGVYRAKGQRYVEVI